jgi:hypothetical protein
MTMPAGVYYVGDLSYVMQDKQVCHAHTGEFQLDNGHRAAVYATVHGNGEQTDCFDNWYSVYSGTVGCMLASDIDLQDDDAVGNIIEFTSDFETGVAQGVVYFGNLTIDTNVILDPAVAAVTALRHYLLLANAEETDTFCEEDIYEV